ncbi:MAG: threonine aldolase family protein [Janthinobacterium lividum]
MNFTSDNIAGASPKILQAIVDGNVGTAAPYGMDPWTVDAQARLSTVFEREVASFLVATGTGSNALALAAVAPPGTAIFCHLEAHVIEDECGAPEFFTSGGKLVGIPGDDGKITPEGLRAALSRFPRGIVRQVQPAALSLSQVTEAGTLYSLAEISALSDIAHDAGLAVHMDGARFANAVAALGVSPADLTWRSGIDILSFGATKNGAIACEAIVFLDPAKADDFLFRRKRTGHTVSKGRFLGIQMAAFLDEDHWLDLARHANRAAQRLSRGLAAVPGVRLPWPTQANEVFLIVPAALDEALKAAGGRYYPWATRSLSIGDGPAPDERMLRLICAFDTRDEAIDEFIEVAARAGAVHV